MASDFSVEWQFSHSRKIGFALVIKKTLISAAVRLVLVLRVPRVPLDAHVRDLPIPGIDLMELRLGRNLRTKLC
jgi:hypothetical protein